MLDRIEFALRKYEGIAPDLSDEMTTAQADQLKEWLNSDVKEITSSLLARPGFRNRVLWPLDKLAGRSVCDEREAVLAVDQSLVKFAELLADFARKPAIWEQLHRLGTYLEAVHPGDTSDPPEGLPFVEFLGTRPWKDLVSESDYFSSAADFNYREQGEENEEGNEEKGKGKRRSERWLVFMPFGNPRLRPPGDFVSRHGYST